MTDEIMAPMVTASLAIALEKCPIRATKIGVFITDLYAIYSSRYL